MFASEAHTPSDSEVAREKEDLGDIGGPDLEGQQLPEGPAAESSDTDVGPDCGLQPTDEDFREQKEREGSLLPPKEQRGWRKVIRNFTPS